MEVTTLINMKSVSLFGAAIVLFSLAWFVWPTRYHYSQVKIGSNTYPVRIDRITNSTQMLSLGGWVDLGDNDKPVAKTAELIPASELVKLEGRGSIEGSSFIVSAYNGSDWIVTHIDINLTVKENDGSVRFLRKYQVWCTRPQNRGLTMTASQYSCDLGEYLGSYYYTPKFEWRILSAYGYKD